MERAGGAVQSAAWSAQGRAVRSTAWSAQGARPETHVGARGAERGVERAGGVERPWSALGAQPETHTEHGPKRTRGRGWCRAPVLAGCDQRKARSYPVAA